MRICSKMIQIQASERVLNAPTGQIVSVQVLRAIAALTVVFGHAQHDALISAGRTGIEFVRNHLLPWGAGVDLFFVISGFIMVHASARLFGSEGAGVIFLRRRLIRIVPLYWLISSAYIILSHGFANAGSKTEIGLDALIASYLFWPMDIFRDGFPRPIYTLGWTLNYEMLFYAVFAACLALPRRVAVLTTSLLLTTGVALGALIPLESTSLAFWTKPIILEFVLGMAIAEARHMGWRLGRVAQGLALALALAILLTDPMGASLKPDDWITPNDGVRLFCWGVPAALIMAALLLVSDRTVQTPTAQIRTGKVWQLAVALGDASYALYLVHPFVIVSLRKIWLLLGLQNAVGFWPMVALAMLLSTILSLAIHARIEKPVTNWLLHPKKSAQPATT